MKLRYLLCVLTFVGLGAGSSAFGYQLKRPPKGDACATDGSACNVYCDNGALAGTMYWNGSKWSDGVRSETTMDAEARRIVAANGTECK